MAEVRDSSTAKIVPPKSVEYKRIDVPEIFSPMHVDGFQLGKDELTGLQIALLKKLMPGDKGLQSITTRCKPYAKSGPAAKACKLPAALHYRQMEAACRLMGGRLPTELEWEYAATAGGQITSDKWATADGEQRDKGGNLQACIRSNCKHGPKPVGSFAPNPWGFTDMTGNIAEWTSSCYDGIRSDGDCVNRVVRGGAWNHIIVEQQLQILFRGYSMDVTLIDEFVGSLSDVSPEVQTWQNINDLEYLKNVKARPPEQGGRCAFSKAPDFSLME